MKEIILDFLIVTETIFTLIFANALQGEVMFKNLSCRASVVFGYEVANHVLVRLPDSPLKKTLQYSSTKG